MRARDEVCNVWEKKRGKREGEVRMRDFMETFVNKSREWKFLRRERERRVACLWLLLFPHSRFLVREMATRVMYVTDEDGEQTVIDTVSFLPGPKTA